MLRRFSGLTTLGSGFASAYGWLSKIWKGCSSTASGRSSF
jgi:hypothetical protein